MIRIHLAPVALSLALVAVAPAAAQTRAAAGTPAPVAAAPPATFPGGLSPADWREADPQSTVLFETTRGRIFVELAPWLAPRHVQRIRELARERFYDGVVFHRVIDGFMAQGGDPTGTGTGGSTKPDLPAEFTFRRGMELPFTPMPGATGASLAGFLGGIPVTTMPESNRVIQADRRLPSFANHCPGVASMARSADPGSANSQFFLMRGANLRLDRQYTAWGRVVAGLDVVLALRTGEPVVNPDRMTRVRVLADLPARERPRVFVERTDGPAFQARLAALAAASQPGTLLSNCAIAPEGRVSAP